MCGFIFRTTAIVSILKANPFPWYVNLTSLPLEMLCTSVHIVINSGWYTIGMDYLLTLRHLPFDRKTTTFNLVFFIWTPMVVSTPYKIEMTLYFRLGTENGSKDSVGVTYTSACPQRWNKKNPVYFLWKVPYATFQSIFFIIFIFSHATLCGSKSLYHSPQRRNLNFQ